MDALSSRKGPKPRTYNRLGGSRRIVLGSYWNPRVLAANLCLESRKRLRDVLGYVIFDFHRGPFTVRSLLLAGDAGGGEGPNQISKAPCHPRPAKTPPGL